MAFGTSSFFSSMSRAIKEAQAKPPAPPPPAPPKPKFSGLKSGSGSKTVMGAGGYPTTTKPTTVASTTAVPAAKAYVPPDYTWGSPGMGGGLSSTDWLAGGGTGMLGTPGVPIPGASSSVTDMGSGMSGMFSAGVTPESITTDMATTGGSGTIPKGMEQTTGTVSMYPTETPVSQPDLPATTPIVDKPAPVMSAGMGGSMVDVSNTPASIPQPIIGTLGGPDLTSISTVKEGVEEGLSGAAPIIEAAAPEAIKPLIEAAKGTPEESPEGEKTVTENKPTVDTLVDATKEKKERELSEKEIADYKAELQAGVDKISEILKGSATKGEALGTELKTKTEDLTKKGTEATGKYQTEAQRIVEEAKGLSKWQEGLSKSYEDIAKRYKDAFSESEELRKAEGAVAQRDYGANAAMMSKAAAVGMGGQGMMTGAQQQMMMSTAQQQATSAYSTAQDRIAAADQQRRLLGAQVVQSSMAQELANKQTGFDMGARGLAMQEAGASNIYNTSMGDITNQANQARSNYGIGMTGLEATTNAAMYGPEAGMGVTNAVQAAKLGQQQLAATTAATGAAQRSTDQYNTGYLELLKSGQQSGPNWSSALTRALTGAGTGFAIGGAPGAGVGAGVGFLSAMFE